MDAVIHTIKKWWKITTRLTLDLSDFPIHPLLFAAAPILLLFQTNKDEVKPDELVLPLACVIFICCCMYLVSKLAFKSWRKAAVLTSLTITLLLSYGYIKQFLSDLPLPPRIDPDLSSFGWNKLLYGLFGVMWLMSAVWLWRTRHSLRLPNKALTVMSVALVIFPLASLVWLLGSKVILQPLTGKMASATSIHSTKNQTRDIYYLVPEDYASNSILKREFDFDNTDFTNWLSSQGFYVAAKARTNYPRSSFSLASTLRMDYLQNLSPLNGDPRPEVSTVFPRLQNPLVGRFLKSKGYTFIQMSSWFEPTRTSAIADEVLNFSTSKIDLSHFQRIVLSQSMVAPMFDSLFKLNEFDQQYYGLEYQFKEFPRVIAEPGPKFIFAHILMPHSPEVYDQHCNRLDDQTSEQPDQGALYLGQIQCVNQRLKSVITNIRQSDPDAIIMLQSDEGAADVDHEMAGDEYTFANTSTAERQKRSEMLAAYYFPDGGESVLYQTISPVNSFRLLMNYYFGTNYAKLPDKTYLTPDSGHLFNFIDATDELNKAQASL